MTDHPPRLPANAGLPHLAARLARTAITQVAALALLAASLAPLPALASPGCVKPAERDALEIKKLSSELMVTSEACGAEDRYNAYMRRYQTAWSGNEAVLSAYFKRSYGRSYQKSYDDFTTDLANVQMQQGLGSGSAFCGILASVFDEVMALDGPAELADYARSKPFAMPAKLSTCAATDAPAKPARHKSSKKKKA